MTETRSRARYAEVVAAVVLCAIVSSALAACSSGRASAAGQSAGSSSTTTPPATPSLGIGSPFLNGSVSGTSISVTGTVDSSGLPVNMSITSNSGGSHTCSNVTGSSASCSLNAGSLSYSSTYNYTLTVTDASGNNRQSRTAAWAGRTPDPAPSVSVRYGARHRVSPYCVSPGCSWVVVSTSGFTSNVSCEITYYNPAPPYGGTAGFVTWTQGANEADHTGPNYADKGGGPVTVKCTDGQRHSASNRIQRS